MTYGEKIAHLRKSNGMTQEDLGKVLNVTYQAVSKWERGESLPDFTTMSQLARFFQVPLSYFEEDGEVAQTQVQSEAPVTVTNNYVGTCTVCGRMIKEDDEYIADPKLICKSCAELAEQEKQKEKEKKERYERYRKDKEIREQLGKGFDLKLVISLVLALATFIVFTISAFDVPVEDRIGAGISIIFFPLAVFGIVHSIADFINELRDNDDDELSYTRNLSLIIGGVFAVANIVVNLVMFFSFGNDGIFIGTLFAGTIISFTFISQFMWGGIIKSIFTCGGFTFKLPGFIFSLTLDSILWMIITKIVLGVVSVVVFIITTVIVALVAMIGSVVTFIPCVIAKSAKDNMVVRENS